MPVSVRAATEELERVLKVVGKWLRSGLMAGAGPLRMG